ncbi:Protein N-acetyltransferase, RimJ/RimL family [Enhydrobacter aerosaccus]|uniref:Protein N-acetyltransferase, RimJ/RimL family n=1 Tax=Enhydrobacter aerosaccus TaxID=225324 RepID=A0A1T4SG25_9HYPH|nr:GNAT family N-acetyltransferase [Enhydrobacter aerosaccus]SKA27254.1 Protein N-acetyltransferase, RimJ/RimL family [Enhydrobacter aerosaccus]
MSLPQTAILQAAILQTERLTLRPLLPGDAEAYAAMRYHPEVARWLLPAAGDPLEASRAAIARYAASWRERGYAPWGVFRDGRLIGHAGLNFVAEFGETEVLWSLHPDAWGHGFATEAARAALAFGFDTLGLSLIFAMTKPDNLASQAVMKRLGLSYRKDVVYRGIEAVWFEIARETFEAAKAGAKPTTPT